GGRPRPAPPAPRRQRSSAVEQPIRNRQVVGSNPTVGSRRPRPGPCLGGVSFRPARGWGPVPVPVRTPAATLHPARGTAPTLAARWAVGKVVRHVVFAASVALYVVVVGQNWAHYTAALLAQVWVRYRGELGAVPLTIGGGPAYLLPGRVTSAIPSGSPPSTNVRTTVDEPTSIPYTIPVAVAATKRRAPSGDASVPTGAEPTGNRTLPTRSCDTASKSSTSESAWQVTAMRRSPTGATRIGRRQVGSTSSVSRSAGRSTCTSCSSLLPTHSSAPSGVSASPSAPAATRAEAVSPEARSTPRRWPVTLSTTSRCVGPLSPSLLPRRRRAPTGTARRRRACRASERAGTSSQRTLGRGRPDRRQRPGQQVLFAPFRARPPRARQHDHPPRRSGGGARGHGPARRPHRRGLAEPAGHAGLRAHVRAALRGQRRAPRRLGLAAGRGVAAPARPRRDLHAHRRHLHADPRRGGQAGQPAPRLDRAGRRVGHRRLRRRVQAALD